MLKRGKSPDIFKCVQHRCSETRGRKPALERQNFPFNWVLLLKGCQSSALDTKSHRKRIEKVVIQRNWVGGGVAPFGPSQWDLFQAGWMHLFWRRHIADIQTDSIPHCPDTAGGHLFIARRGKNTLLPDKLKLSGYPTPYHAISC